MTIKFYGLAFGAGTSPWVSFAKSSFSCHFLPNVPMPAPAPRTEVDEQQRSGCGLRDMTCWTLVNSRLIVYQCCQGFACESLLFSLETSRINHFRTTATRFDVLSSSITTMSLLSLSRHTYVVSVDSTNFPLTSRE